MAMGMTLPLSFSSFASFLPPIPGHHQIIQPLDLLKRPGPFAELLTFCNLAENNSVFLPCSFSANWETWSGSERVLRCHGCWWQWWKDAGRSEGEGREGGVRPPQLWHLNEFSCVLYPRTMCNYAEISLSQSSLNSWQTLPTEKMHLK